MRNQGVLNGVVVSPSFFVVDFRFICWAAILGLAASSCGGQAAAVTAHDGGEADAESGTNGPEAAVCEPSSDAGEPELIGPVDLDGAVPLDQAALATAIARCEYWNRCLPLAAYELDQCIVSLTRSGAWRYTECMPVVNPDAVGIQCESLGVTIPLGPDYPGPGLVDAVEAGIVTYDPIEEAACLRARQAQPCDQPGPIDLIRSCVAAFSCPVDAGSNDAGTSDGGRAACASFTSQAPALTACTTDLDCAEVLDAAIPAGPYCVGGYCAYDRCDAILRGPDGGCLAPVENGQLCDSDPPRLGAFTLANPSGKPSIRMCRAGLTCRGIPADGGLGRCAPAQEIGGPCVGGAAVTGCALGLVCECGVCRMPPTQGACVDDVCKAGVAFCDSSARCQPARGVGGDCTMGQQACATGLSCDQDTNTCKSR